MRLQNIRQILLILVFVGIVAGLSPAIRAQEINAFLGNTNSSFGPWSIRSSSVWGGSFEYPIWYDVTFEQRVAYLMNFPEPSIVNTRTGSLLMDTTLNLKIPFTFFGLVPYVSAGFGFMHAVRNDPNNIGTNLDFTYGGGAKYRIPFSPFGLRLDIRGHRFRNVISEKDINTIEYSLGLIYRMRKG